MPLRRYWVTERCGVKIGVVGLVEEYVLSGISISFLSIGEPGCARQCDDPDIGVAMVPEECSLLTRVEI